ncbi:hypothetical protein KC992_03690 [Candidatus Saccharibacteria bacterium]|nr:hypothetical protein [Candidatus Saccharibacteria bacterium]
MDTNDSSAHQLPSVDDNQVVDDAQLQASMPAAQQDLSQYPMAQQGSDPTLPMEAGDVDLIEKAWVEKAKAIVRSTHGDPYTQNKEINKVKADYIRKRYNREVKVIE